MYIKSLTYIIAYIILSGLRALIMHNLCKAVLLFHSCGNFSLSGLSHSTNFFHRFGEFSMSLSKFLNSSFVAKLHIPPQLEFERKSTGLVTCGFMGNLSRKSRSVDKISSFIKRIYNRKISLHYHKLWKVIKKNIPEVTPTVLKQNKAQDMDFATDP